MDDPVGYVLLGSAAVPLLIGWHLAKRGLDEAETAAKAAKDAAANALGNIPMPLPFSLLKGGHAMCIVGYDFDPDVPGGAGLIVRNSRGTGWAPRSAIAPGYGVLPFPYVEQYGWGAFVFTDA
jgi:C1A family cysteine protease